VLLEKNSKTFKSESLADIIVRTINLFTYLLTYLFLQYFTTSSWMSLTLYEKFSNRGHNGL